jgi:superfamily I DNA/RNA helicase
LVFRTHKILDTYQQYLKSKDFKTKVIEADKADNNQQADHVRLATMHRVKGLQFDYIFLPSLNCNILPLQSVVEKCADESSQNRFIQGEKCLLYVAATRAKKPMPYP